MLTHPLRHDEAAMRPTSGWVLRMVRVLRAFADLLHRVLVQPRLHLALRELQIDEVFAKVHLIRRQGPLELAFDHEEVVV